jgi:hypothetical protein
MLTGKVSYGSAMDQIYIPKKRNCLPVGSLVLIEEINPQLKINPYYHNLNYLEPIKDEIIKSIFHFMNSEENIIITGSFLEPGFQFEDIDIIVFGNALGLKEFVLSNFGIHAHIIQIRKNDFLKGINTDPLYQMVISKFISRERFIFEINNEYNFKLLDLALVKSELLITNFEITSGQEKYKLLRNTFAIKRFLEHKEISKDFLEKDIENYFSKGFLKDFQKNLISLKDFRKKFEKLYEGISSQIMDGIKEQEKTLKNYSRKSE